MTIHVAGRGIVMEIESVLVLEVFVDDIGAKVEVNPDKVEVKNRRKPKKKTRLLRKEEKKALYDMLSDIDANCSDVVSTVNDSVSKECHIHIYKDI